MFRFGTNKGLGIVSINSNLLTQNCSQSVYYFVYKKDYGLTSLIKQAMDELNNEPKINPNIFFVKQNNILVRVAIDEVLWIKAEGNYCMIFTVSKKYIIKLSLKKALNQLPSGYFRQIQRAYIVAIPKITDIDLNTNEVVVNDKRLPLGRKYREGLIKNLHILK